VVKNLCQLLHAERQKAAIKIRQPLAKATINTNLSPELIEIIKDETNIKEIIIGKEINLDITITPELAAEGEYRDFVRNIQVLRKTQGLQVQDRIKIVAPSWPADFEKQILEKTLADFIQIGDTLTLEKIS